jgi:hypothetical protein
MTARHRQGEGSRTTSSRRLKVVVVGVKAGETKQHNEWKISGGGGSVVGVGEARRRDKNMTKF